MKGTGSNQLQLLGSFLGAALILIVLVLLSLGCASSGQRPTLPTTSPQKEYIDPPLEDRETQLIPERDFDPKPIDQGEASPGTGLLIDERTAFIHTLIKLERDRRREEVVIERRARELERQILERTLEDTREACQETWWDRNGHIIVGVGGFVLGAALTFGVTAAVAGLGGL